MKTRGRPLCSTQGNDTRRRAIAKASAHSFAKLGYDKTTIRRVAEKAGVDPKWVMDYFGSKELLFLSTIPMPINPVGTGRLLRLVPRSMWGQSLPRYFFPGASTVALDRRLRGLFVLRHQNPWPGSFFAPTMESFSFRFFAAWASTIRSFAR